MLYAAGPNYRGHVEGMAARRGAPPSYPDRPSPNYRSVHAIIGAEENIVVPAECSGAVQPEGQLAVVIGKKARNVPVSQAIDYVFGYTIAYGETVDVGVADAGPHAVDVSVVGCWKWNLNDLHR